MSLAGVIAWLHERYATVDGIAAMLDYEPRAVQKTPLLYSLLDNVRREPAGNVMEERYRIRSRVCLSWGDPAAAEAAVAAFAEAIPAVVDPAGKAYVEEVDAGWATINQVDYRVVDFYVVVMAFTPPGGA